MNPSHSLRQRSSFWVLFIVLIALFCTAWFLPRPAQGDATHGL
jgi:hypothetical protein